MDKIRITSYQAPFREKLGEMKISNLSQEEFERFQGLIHGQNWMSVKDGRMVFRGIFAPLPDPVEDQEMLPFWNREDARMHMMQKEIFDQERMAFPFAAHIVIQHLCGYEYTPENYKKEAEKLVRYGFAQMRSRRGNDGQFWEIWFLPGTWAAQEELRDVVKLSEFKTVDPAKKGKGGLEAAVEFLRQNVKFGSLEVSIQKLAMVPND